MSQTFAAALNPALSAQVATAAESAGLTLVSSEDAQGFSGNPITRFLLATASDPGKTMRLDLSQSFDFSAGLAPYLVEAARRMRNPRPECYLTLSGLPLSFTQFAWPFHESTAGADTSLVHGQVNLEDGAGSVLHAKIAASLTVTLRETVEAPEQPFAESVIYNAVRKTMDQGQLELVRSGNRQPVPVTTRYYSVRNGKFNFNDTTAAQRVNFLAAKTFWLSGVLGGGAGVWLVDPRDAQYLNTTVEELRKDAATLVKDGLATLSTDGEYGAPTETLMSRRTKYEAGVSEALASIKPTFNEDMRAGHTNM
jgi:hypothetical protein